MFEAMNKIIMKMMEKQQKNNIMKIAVACNGTQIWPHFGHCENFNIYEVNNGKIECESSIPNPGHTPGFLPNFLADNGVEVIIAGGMGGGAVEIFNQRNIEVIIGAEGNDKAAVEAYLRGELKSTGSICREHAANCGE